MFEEGIAKNFTEDVDVEMKDIEKRMKKEHLLFNNFFANNKQKDIENLKEAIEFIEKVLAGIYELYNKETGENKNKKE